MNKSKEEIHAFITKINEDLHGFIAKTIQENEEIGTEWSHLFDQAQNPKCYEIMGCTKADCPIHGTNDYKCWLQVGTLCGREVQGDFAQKFGNCVKCEVYHRYHEEPVRALYENIDVLISHLSGEVGEYRRRSITDRLTGAYNRNFFEELVTRELDKAARLNLSSSVLMIDLNNFKNINDTLGHLTGDEFLKETVRLLQANIRYSDVIFRMGGDEFLVFLVNTTRQECDTCSKRIQTAVQQWNKTHSAKYGAELSLSVGMETLSSGDKDYLTAIKRADERMYAQKEASRTETPS